MAGWGRIDQVKPLTGGYKVPDYKGQSSRREGVT